MPWPPAWRPWVPTRVMKCRERRSICRNSFRSSGSTGTSGHQAPSPSSESSLRHTGDGAVTPDSRRPQTRRSPAALHPGPRGSDPSPRHPGPEDSHPGSWPQVTGRPESRGRTSVEGPCVTPPHSHGTCRPDGRLDATTGGQCGRQEGRGRPAGGDTVGGRVENRRYLALTSKGASGKEPFLQRPVPEHGAPCSRGRGGGLPRGILGGRVLPEQAPEARL